MGMADESMEALFREKMAVYQRLAALLKEERKQIVGADVDALWEMSEKKQALVEEVRQIRSRILKAATALSIDHGMTPKNFQASRLLPALPPELRRKLDGAVSSMGSIKKEIHHLSRENKQYIESKLGMIDELMSIMTGREHEGQGYGAAGTGSGSPVLIRREI